MGPMEIIALAEALAKLAGVVHGAINNGKAALDADTAAKVKAILDPIHAGNMDASAALDAKLAAVE